MRPSIIIQTKEGWIVCRVPSQFQGLGRQKRSMSSITPEWGVPRLSLVQLLLLKLLVLLLPPVVCHLPRGRQRRPSARTHVSLPPNYFLLPILTLIILRTRTHAYARPSTQYVIQKTQCAMRQCSNNEKACKVYPRPLLSRFQLNKKRQIFQFSQKSHQAKRCGSEAMHN